MGIDLPCGAGRVAALGRPRRPIHSRSRSIPIPLYAKEPGRRRTLLHMERIMGIEPTSTAWEAVVLPMNYIRIVWMVL